MKVTLLMIKFFSGGLISEDESTGKEMVICLCKKISKRKFTF